MHLTRKVAFLLHGICISSGSKLQAALLGPCWFFPEAVVVASVVGVVGHDEQSCESAVVRGVMGDVVCLLSLEEATVENYELAQSFHAQRQKDRTSSQDQNLLWKVCLLGLFGLAFVFRQSRGHKNESRDSKHSYGCTKGKLVSTNRDLKEASLMTPRRYVMPLRDDREIFVCGTRKNHNIIIYVHNTPHLATTTAPNPASSPRSFPGSCNDTSFKSPSI